jgi:hypothetical protein
VRRVYWPPVPNEFAYRYRSERIDLGGSEEYDGGDCEVELVTILVMVCWVLVGLSEAIDECPSAVDLLARCAAGAEFRFAISGIAAASPPEFIETDITVTALDAKACRDGMTEKRRTPDFSGVL